MINANVCKIELAPQTRGLKASIKAGIKQFRRLDILISTGWHIRPQDTDERPGMQHVSRKLAAIIGLYGEAYPTASPPIQLKISFIFGSDCHQQYTIAESVSSLIHRDQYIAPTSNQTTYQLWEVQTYGASIQTRLAFAVEDAYLRKRPRLNVNIVTNADKPVKGVEVERVDQNQIKFRIKDVHIRDNGDPAK
jgi:hypothetical protein